LKFVDNSELCPFTVLYRCIDKTAEQTASARSSKPVFVTTIQKGQNWYNRALDQRCPPYGRGDTEVFQLTLQVVLAHLGQHRKVFHILKATNWSSQTTFEQYYFCPSTSATYTRTILQSITENRYNK